MLWLYKVQPILITVRSLNETYKIRSPDCGAYLFMTQAAV